MSEPFLGEIRLFSGNYAPEGWALCNGASLPISGNEALYSLIGTTYGGDGRTTFKVPDLRGRLPVGQGQGTGLTMRTVAQSGGASTVQLTAEAMPTHSHLVMAGVSSATSLQPSGASLANTNPLAGSGSVARYVSSGVSGSTVVQMAAGAITTAYGGSGVHNNVMPYMALQYIMALQGLYPQRPS